ncbi:N-acetylmuramoyl-L-alanine amidase [Arenibacterium sp. CAU 1754]
MEPGPFPGGREQLNRVSAVWHPSPNFTERRDGLTPSLVVLHFTAMDSAQAALDRLCDPKAEVSAHYLISSDGTLFQMVQEEMRAWHAGAGEWAGVDDINSRSIGIELDNTGAHPFSEPQMRALENLLAGVMQRWDIPARGVIGHSCMAPGRKFDPGARFDWARLARSGLAEMPAPAVCPCPDMARFRDMARAAGFTAQAEPQTLLEAVRLRYRPWGRGPLSAADMGVLAALCPDLPAS